MKKTPKTVDAYIADAPKDIQVRLTDIRNAIRSIAPNALEKISYGMPYYGYKGRLVYFAAFKHHIGVYISPPIVEEHQKELKDYHTAMATIRFPHDKPLPIQLIKKLVKARMKKNDEVTVK
jgi:uncharacterized protein YdhG (YjbR/CyaY superfamily)